MNLANWTPIGIDASGPYPIVEWADLTGIRFEEPFFNQTIALWTKGPVGLPRVRTGLKALAEFDTAPSLNPSGMIFHLSRCGSTLVSRLLGKISGALVIAEPAPLNTLLEVDLDRVNEEALVATVRLLVRALGRRRFGDEQYYVLKLSSWNIQRRAILAKAFPDTPWLWVQRNPAEVLGSLCARPPGWLSFLQRFPPRGARLFGLAASKIPAMDQTEFAARALGAMIASAAAESAGRLVIDYDDLPNAVWSKVCEHFGLKAEDEAISQMRAGAILYSKEATPQRFVGDSERRPITEEIQSAAARFVMPGYLALRSTTPPCGGENTIVSTRLQP